ncbi:MAG: hypothetical protein HKN47_07240, partial [Pirellulaceae bacterium]|nr:hypothetical protein [Pirellulaceae bacterium]
ANTTLEQNADGRGTTNDTRVGRGDNAPSTVFVSASQPIIIGNDFVDGGSSALSFDVNSLSSLEINDPGRSTGMLDRTSVVGNTGPLIQNNSMTGNAINGLQVRGGELATAGVWDDIDMVHVVTESIEIPNQHIFGGLRLQSDARGSLVVKFESGDNANAGIVVGGTLLTGAEQLRDIPDRIGGALQIIGHPDFPVVLTTLQDDFSGAGFTRSGTPAVDTNGDGIRGGDLGDQQFDGLSISPNGGVTTGGPSFVILPTGPEVNLGTTINNDVDPNTPGYFEVTVPDANDISLDSVTYQTPAGLVLTNQDLIFQYSTYVTVGNTTLNLSATNITQAATLIADDLVESRGTFAGPNGQVNWIARSTFIDGVASLFTTLVLDAEGGGALGDIRVTTYLDEDINVATDDILTTTGTPGASDFRVYTLDGPDRVGFAQGGYYTQDGVNLINATWTGWAADVFPDLETAIAGSTQTFSIAGTIDVAALPPFVDPALGNANGPNDVTTAFAWNTSATASTATITSFLELLPTDPSRTGQVDTFEAGLWNGITIREAASDRNVAAIAEEEPVRTAVFGTNDIPSQSQFLGELAPNEQSGDENRRLGFVIDGAVTTRDDIDVYSFVAESNTEIWLDIDRTGNQFDSVVELIDANGRVLAASNDSLLTETNPNAVFVASDVNPDAAQPLSVVPDRLQAQEITITESVVDATAGEITLTPSNSLLTVSVPFDTFLTDPADSIRLALETNYPELGPVTATLLRRSARVVDPATGNLLRAGEDFVVRLQFDETLFVGASAPVVAVATTGVVGPSPVDATPREVLLDSQLQDTYSSNAKDAGMRLRLPGEANTRNLYHIRVRSSNTPNPLDFATLTNPSLVRGGLTTGRYELQVRIQEQDERPGTQVRLADIRYATTGLQIIGQPLHSPLLGEEYETTASNETLAEAQPLGYFGANADLTVGESNLLASDQLAKSFAGMIDSATDVDWYQFDIQYENLTRDAASLYLSTVFDLDYASNFARSDMALYVFNAAGQLILVGGDSNIADDQPGSANSNDTGDLDRGSAGNQDPYIGTAELAEGTYFVAVSNQTQVPLPLDQFFNRNTLNPLLRLEPIDSVTRIAEDHIFVSGGGTASAPEVPLLFDNNSFVEYTFDDVLLYVNTSAGLTLVNPFTGDNYGPVGTFNQNRTFSDVAFAANGELFGYSDFVGPATDATWFYHNIDTGDASLGAPISVGAGITTYQWDGVVQLDGNGNQVGIPTLNVVSNTGLAVEGITIRERNNVEEGFFIANRPDVGALGVDYFDNILYRFDERTGLSQGANVDPIFVGNGGAGTSPREVGQLDTVAPLTARPIQLGITSATEINRFGVSQQSIFDGDSFTLDDLTNPPVTFEFDQSFTLTANGANPVRDGDAIQIDGKVFEFNTGTRIQLDQVAPAGLLSDGATLSVVGVNGQTARFEFVRFGQPATGNIAITTVDAFGNARPMASITRDLANAINANVLGVGAISRNDEVFFTGQAPASLTVTGPGVNLIGNNGTTIAGAVAINVEETVARESLIIAIADTLRANGVAVSNEGTQLSLPAAAAVTILTGDALTLTGSPGVTPGNVAILVFPTDSAQILARRIESAVDNLPANQLPNVTVTPQGRSLSIAGAVITNVSGNLTAGGVPTGGMITGVELLGNDLYAVTNTGGLFRVGSGTLAADGNRQIGQYVSRSTDLIGINFSGLRAGPAHVQDGELSNILFGITFTGDVYAFNTFGELQPVFAGGRSVISTGIFGAEGLDFSTLDYNLWHVTDTRETDPGHGINPIATYRAGSGGGNSLAFTFEDDFQFLYPGLAEYPGLQPRIDGEPVNSTYNFPGGAKGVLNSNPFNLEGYSPNDQPMLYFNYFLETDDGPDRLRIYVVTEQGVEHLVSSNSDTRFLGTPDDEFDDPSPFVAPYIDEIDVETQQLYDNTNNWRQARVPLSEFAGERNLTLRIEYTTNGSTRTGSNAIRTIAGDLLIEGQQITVNNETFVLDFAPTLSVPSGSILADLYDQGPAVQSTITIDGQEYLLNDGTRTPGTNQISIDLLLNTLPGTTLSDLSADEIATAISEAIRTNPPPNPLVTNFNFSDPEDTPGATGQNDFIYEATVLPYSSGNLTITGTGRLGTDPALGSVQHTDDVDLLRVNVVRGTTISVAGTFDFNTALTPVVRFFDSDGAVLPTTFNTTNNTFDYTATTDGVVFIGISGTGNESYDPRLPGTASNGLVDTYNLSVNINLSTAILTDANTIEINGTSSLTTSPSNLFTVVGTDVLDGIPIRISRFMTPSEVAEQVQRAIANRFTGGDFGSLPTAGATVTLPDFVINDPGPFSNTALRYGDNYRSIDPVDGARNNTFEGVFLDDFIIGFAERGETATGSNVVDSAFITDGLPSIPVPADPVSNLQTGSYQVEIRDGSEYVASGIDTAFRTINTNDRLAESSRSIVARSASQLQDGFMFSISDGRSTVEFEFDLVESNTGVTPGRVAVPYTLLAVEPGSEEIDVVTGLPLLGTGVIRPQTATEVAFSIIDAVNRTDVQSIIDVPALPSSGVDAITDSRINLFGEVLVSNPDGALAAVTLGESRGDANRERDSQGVILIENSRFLSNEEYGIDITHDVTADINGNPTESIVRYPRNLIELNTENLKPGVVVQSNVFAFNGSGGLQIAGIDGLVNETGADPVPFERIVNNTFIGGTITAGTQSPAATFQGILFDQGTISFADSVFDYSPDAGGAAPTFAFQDETQALGAPDGGGRGPEPLDGSTTVSLGLGGTLTVEFTDNLLTGSGDARPDLIVFETGAVESVRVEISRDGQSFFDVGLLGGLTNQLDIDASGFGSQDRFSFVRLTDVRQGDPNIAQLGADIDAIGALSTVPVDNFTPGGAGITVVGDAAPALLNNVISNSDTGIQIDPTNTSVVLGGNTYYRNTENIPPGASFGQFAQVLSPSEVVFVAPADLVFAPAAGASIIDSSIDSLEDRASLTTVRNPLGIPPSPILAPRLDVNGQLRVDDPSVETPGGLGESVFKDRGASDRGDLAGPRVVLLSPRAPGLGTGAGIINVLGDPPAFFEIQIIDGLAPADVTPGTGVDDRTIDSDSVLLLKDNVALVEGVDYRFGYNPSTNIMRLTPIAGVWEQDSTYVIRMIDASDAVIAAADGNTYTDGQVLNVLDTIGGSTPFEYELGLQIALSSSLNGTFGDGITFDVFDGNNLISFELDSNQLFDPDNNPVVIPAAGNANQIAAALAAAINASAALNFTAAVSDSTIQLLGGTPLSSVQTANPFVMVNGTIGTSPGFGIRIPADGAAPDSSITDGQTFVVRRGALTEVTFELDFDGTVDTPNATAVTLPADPTLDQIADAIVRAIGGAGLGLSPENAGFGQVFLGGDANYSVELTNSTLQQIGVPGAVANTPIEIPIDLEAVDISPLIAAVVDSANLAGVSTTVVDTRVFVEGTGGVNGTGAADLITIQDEVGNQLQSNQANGRTELTIFIGSGFDYGDAPAPYLSLDIQNGPRHAVDPTFSLGATVTPDSNALLVDADADDGVVFTSALQAGFSTNALITINNADNRQFYLDAWFDWNQNGLFELSELQQYGSAGTGRSVLANGTAPILVNVPADAELGEIYARFRLSEFDGLASTGDVPLGPKAGEVEDYRLIVTNNPFQNPILPADVNGSGFVTPIDALQVINFLSDQGATVNLSDTANLPAQRPLFPDVNGDGFVTPGDILAVINFLTEQAANGGVSPEFIAQGEQLSTSLVPTSTSGLMATSATALGDALIGDALNAEQVTAAEATNKTSTSAKTSVFDHLDLVEIDSVVDSLAKEAGKSDDSDDGTDVLDGLFAQL